MDLGFQKGGANMDIYIHGKKVDTTTQHVEHALSRGIWGHVPTRKFYKFGLPRLNLVVILSEK